MHRIKFILPLLLLVTNLFAQDSYQEVDNKSYQLYMDKNWQELSQYGQSASEKGYDYYYLNVRTGIAFFELKDFENAKIYFQKALQNSSTSIFVKEYLFWSYYHLEEESEAQKIYQLLPDSIQKRMDYDPLRIVDYIYAEGGIKMSNNKVAADNLLYGRIGFNHQFSTRFSIYQQYTYMQQKAIWGDMKQHQYLLLPSINLNKKWTISLAFNYSNYQSNLDYDDQATWKDKGAYSSDSGRYNVDSTISKYYIFEGIYRQNALLSQININKEVAGWSFTPHAAFYQVWVTPDYQKTITTQNDLAIIKVMTPPPPILQTTHDSLYKEYKEKEIYQQWQQGINVSFNNDKTISFGADINFIYHKDFSNWNVIPYMRANISKNFSIFAYYVRKGNYVLSMFNGTQFLNSFDEIKNKINVTGEFKLFKKLELFTTYQYESVTDNLSLRDYQLNSIFIGLKFRP